MHLPIGVVTPIHLAKLATLDFVSASNRVESKKQQHHPGTEPAQHYAAAEPAQHGFVKLGLKQNLKPNTPQLPPPHCGQVLQNRALAGAPGGAWVVRYLEWRERNAHISSAADGEYHQ